MLTKAPIRELRVPRAARPTSNQAVELGHRSGLEDTIAGALSQQSIPFEYETVVIPYVKRPATYRPDFLLLSNGILIESKGYFLSEDRTKHLLIRDQHPDLDIRFVFSNSKNRLSASSRTTYAAWAQRNKFLFADRSIPPAWINEAPEPRRMAAVEAFRKGA